MSISACPLIQREITVIIEACCLRQRLFHETKRSASSPTAIRPAESLVSGDKYGSDLSISTIKKKRNDLISKVCRLEWSSIIAIDT